MVEHGLIQRALVMDVVIHGGHVGAGELADFAHRGFGKAARGKDLSGGIKDTLAGGGISGAHSSSSMKHVFETSNRKVNSDAAFNARWRGKANWDGRGPKLVPARTKGLARTAKTRYSSHRSMNNQVLTSQSVGPWRASFKVPGNSSRGK